MTKTLVIGVGALLAVLAGGTTSAQQPDRPFGGTYAELDARRQALVGNWVARFVKATGQSLDAASFYDDVLSLSAKKPRLRPSLMPW